MEDEDKKLLEKHGWVIECESPFEIRKGGWSFASGEAAQIVLDSLRYDENNLFFESKFSKKINEWMEWGIDIPLYDYLGITKEQYELWLHMPEMVEQYY